MFKKILPPWPLKMFIHPPLYKSYEEAVHACQNGAYQNSDLVKVVVDKNLVYRQKIQTDPVFELSALRTLIALGLSKTSDSLNVIDFGGAGGYHYTIASKVLGSEVKLKWNVVETTAMAKEAQRIATDSLCFFDSITEAVKSLGYVDLVFTSGALQYCPNPIAFLRQLVNVNARCFYITRTPFCNADHATVTTQKSKLSENGPGPLPEKTKDRIIKVPVTYASRRAVEDIISEKYVIQFRTQEGEGVFKMPNMTVSMDGYFCVRKG